MLSGEDKKQKEKRDHSQTSLKTGSGVKEDLLAPSGLGGGRWFCRDCEFILMLPGSFINMADISAEVSWKMPNSSRFLEDALHSHSATLGHT